MCFYAYCVFMHIVFLCILSFFPVPTTWQQVKHLSGLDLRSLCVKFKIDRNLSRLAKESLLCSALNISTSGKETPYRFNPIEVHQKKGIKDINVVPKFGDNDVKKYLLSSKVISPIDQWRYKLTQPFMHQANIHSVDVVVQAPFYFLRGQCNGSESTDREQVKWLFAVLNETGEIIDGYCVCSVGYVI